jgi:thiol:disulfide interchange protein DsbD
MKVRQRVPRWPLPPSCSGSVPISASCLPAPHTTDTHLRRADPEQAAPVDELPEDRGLLGGSLWGLILACIGGGLFALVMQCTYPMIPITFSFFTKQADARGGKVMTLALTYGAGIVGMFALIGALASVLGSYIVPFAAHWITNTIIGATFVLFGLSLLGVFTLQPPAFLMNAAGKGRAVGGPVGVLLMGATLVISSFTCTAPVVGTLLIPVVKSGEAWKPILGMAVFGLTMALPFVFLSLLPGRVKALPRSGEWMNTLKVTLGFIELAAALKFFSNAEYAEKRNSNSPAMSVAVTRFTWLQRCTGSSSILHRTHSLTKSVKPSPFRWRVMSSPRRSPSPCSQSA